MNRPINPGRLILATIFAPFIVVALMSLLSTGLNIDGTNLSAPLKTLAALSAFGSVTVGWPAMLLIGLPLHGYLCHKNKRHWHTYALAGAIGGIIAAFVFLLIFEGTIQPYVLAYGAGAGAATALLFHLIRGPHLALTEPPNAPT